MYRQPARLTDPLWIIRRVAELHRDKGLIGTVSHLAAVAVVLAKNAYAALLRPSRVRRARQQWGNRTFTLGGQQYRYFFHGHNDTWSNERAVEIAVAAAFVEGYAGKRVLEVGNVLPNYLSFPHDVVDKHEVGPGVINVDFLEFQPATRYDAIVSISTIEHVGLEDEVPDPARAVAAINHLRSLLNDGGELLVTFPIGYNPQLDALVRSGRLPMDEVRFMRRVTADNQWVEGTLDDALIARYGEPFRSGNVIVIARSCAGHD